jgi:uncharacterized protein YcsI (UPF0317 family)
MRTDLDQSKEALKVRVAARNASLVNPTAGLAPGFVQGNLIVLPAEEAAEFQRFCLRNPKPCPIIGMSDPGNPNLSELGEDLDIRTDIPRYRVWKNGEIVEEPTDVKSWWRDDLVAFVIGCSFSFEEALIADGIIPRHIACGSNVPMFRTNVPTNATGRFHGPLVVSMRPLRPVDAIRAVQITSRFPSVHGAPVHIGLPEEIGILDISKPDYGDPVSVNRGELPTFWACGVTPQSVVQAAKLDFAITHWPGCMLVTDVRNSSLST